MKKGNLYAKNIFNFITVFMSALVFNSSFYAYQFQKNENTPFGISATHEDLLIEGDLKIPEPEEDGKIATLNQMGFMTPDQNPYNTRFIEFAAQSPFPVLEIGAAYGLTVLPTLERGSTVIANDIDERHLLLLREQAPLELRSNLILNKRRFPDETEFPENSLGAILACRVVHFLTGEEMERGIEKMKRWLVPGGQIFVVTLSPYHRHLKDRFLPIYLKRARKNDPWPGTIENMHEYVPHEANKIPKFCHVMDTNSLGQAFQRHGFRVIKEQFFDYKRPNAKSNGDKGYYGIIVEKPTQ